MSILQFGTLAPSFPEAVLSPAVSELMSNRPKHADLSGFAAKAGAGRRYGTGPSTFNTVPSGIRGRAVV